MSAVPHLRRSLGIETGEGRVFAWGASTLFLIGWASVSFTNVSETFFLKRVGVDRLPVVFLINSLLLVGTTYVMSRIVGRTRRRQLLASTFAVLGVMVVLLWLLVLGKVPGVFALLVIAAKQLDAIALITFWMVIGGLLHGRQAKRLYAPIIAGGTLGRILGSFASGIIGKQFGIPALLPVAAVALALAGVLAAQMRSVAPARVTRMRGRQADAPPPMALGKFAPLWRESRLFRLLALSALLGGTLGPMLYFQFSYIVDLATRGSNGEMRLLELYAHLRGFINVGVLAMQLIGTPRIFRHIGVPFASTLSPLVYLLGFFGMSTRLDLPSGIGAMGGTNLQDHAIQDPAQQILITLFPERVRAVATSLIQGPVQRTGGAVGNLLVLAALWASTPASVGFTALPVAALWLGVAITLWRIYPTLLLEVATAGPMHADVALSLPELVDGGTVRVLEASLVDPDPRRCRAACALVAEAPLARAATALARAARNAPAANRPLLVEALHHLIERNPNAQGPVPEAARQLEPLLTNAGSLKPVELAHLIEAYARLTPSLQGGTHGAHVLSRLLTDPAPAVRLAALVHLHRAGVSQGGSGDLDSILATALESDDDAAHHIALEALRARLLATDGGEARAASDVERWEARIAQMTDRLNAPEDRVHAAEVLADVAAHHGARLAASADPLLAHAHDGDPRVRAAVLRFIGHAGLQQHVGWLIERLAADDRTEAAAAAEALRALGPTAANALLDALHRGKRTVRDAVLPILQDMPVSAAALRALVDEEISAIRHILLQLYGLRAGRVSELVVQRLEERIVEGLHTTLLLLATLLHEHRIAALSHLLTRSQDGRARALLLEALEALLPPAESARLLPLLENDNSSALAAAAARALGHKLPSFEEASRETLVDPDRLTRTFLAATLDTNMLTRVGTTVRPESFAAVNIASERDLEHDAPDNGSGCDGNMLKQVEIILHLRSLELFARLTTQELSELAAVVREETYPPGSTIVREGEFGDCMYLVVEGGVRVTREGKLVKRFKPGEFFGEMSVLDGETRSATVTAATPLRLLRLDKCDLLPLMDEQPGIAIAMCQTLSGHLRALIARLEGRARDDSDA